MFIAKSTVNYAFCVCLASSLSPCLIRMDRTSDSVGYVSIRYVLHVSFDTREVGVRAFGRTALLATFIFRGPLAGVALGLGRDLFDQVASCCGPRVGQA